jgi:hypothetical protein
LSCDTLVANEWYKKQICHLLDVTRERYRSWVILLALIHVTPILRCVCKLAKSDPHLRHIGLSVCSSVRLSFCQTRLPLEGFSWILILEGFSKICREFLSFINIWKEYFLLYMNNYVKYTNFSLHFS